MPRCDVNSGCVFPDVWARFRECFQDNGDTDVVASMRAFKEIGFNGPVRPDHVPTLDGESNENPGYEMLGRLWALGYIKVGHYISPV